MCVCVIILCIYTYSDVYVCVCVRVCDLFYVASIRVSWIAIKSMGLLVVSTFVQTCVVATTAQPSRFFSYTNPQIDRKSISRM